MRARSSLSESQREQLVDLFEQGLSYRAAAHRLGVGLYPVKDLSVVSSCMADYVLWRNQLSSIFLRNKEGSCRSVH